MSHNLASSVELEEQAHKRQLGAKIRQLRSDASMTIATLAERAGVSVSLISQIERGHAEPSLNSLRRIGQALGVPVGAMFTGGVDAGSDGVNMRGERLVVRRDSRKLLRAPHTNMTHELLVPDLARQLEVIQTELPPHTRMPGDVSQHDGEETIVVIDGHVTAIQNGEEFEIGPGDTVSWNPAIPHWIENRGDEPATVIGISTPPSF